MKKASSQGLPGNTTATSMYFLLFCPWGIHLINPYTAYKGQHKTSKIWTKGDYTTTNQYPGWNIIKHLCLEQNKRSNLNVYFGALVLGKAIQRVGFVHSEVRKKFQELTNFSVSIKNKYTLGKFKSKMRLQKNSHSKYFKPLFLVNIIILVYEK